MLKPLLVNAKTFLVDAKTLLVISSLGKCFKPFCKINNSAASSSTAIATLLLRR